MIRFSNQFSNKLTSTDIYLADSSALDHNGAKLFPVNFGGRLANELGKELLKAAGEGDSNEIRRLLSEGAPFTADWLGTSPLHLAAQGNHIEVCETLLRAGISTNARTKVDRTPLHLAAYEGHLSIVELFLAEEAEVDCTDLLGMSPLHWAVQNGHAEVVQVLLKSGAYKLMENKFGLKPIDIAYQINRLDIVEILEEEQQEDPRTATENLTIEMAAEDENNAEYQVLRSEEEVADEVEESQALDEEIEQIQPNTREHTHINTLSDSMKILQEHGITMLPNDDDNNILSSVMESGHSVVLTDVGKQVLDSVKASEEANLNITKNLAKTNVITLSADEFLAFAANASINKNQAQIFRQVNGKFVPKIIKRIVMKKNKLKPLSPILNMLKQRSKSPSHTSNLNQVNQSSQNTETTNENNETEVATVMEQLVEAKKTIEEYKLKLIQKEAEAEKYKQQLNILLGCS